MNSTAFASDAVFSDSVVSRVYESLVRSGYSGGILCAGVSGGADSICLLTALVQMFEEIGKNDISDKADIPGKADISNNAREFHKTINVITVNHRIRSEKESGGDCEFVKEYCKKISSDKVTVNCEVVNLAEGEVASLAESRSRGTEEAARYLRYKAFEECAIKVLKKAESECDAKAGDEYKRCVPSKVFFATAHNKNDEIETLVMRFLQGASGFSRCGILEKREVSLEDEISSAKDITSAKDISQNETPFIKDISRNARALVYVRPLLDVSRDEIEKYLSQKNISYKTDSTNSDNSYLRNRIRNVILPVLRENCPGFENSLLAGREKALFESEFVEKSLGKYEWNEGKCADKSGLSDGDGSFCRDSVFMDAEKFYGLDMVLRQNLLFKAFEKLGVKTRIPYGFVKSVSAGLVNSTLKKDEIEALVLDGKLVIKKQKKNQTNCGFFDIIEKECFREYDFGTLSAEHESEGFCDLKFVTNDGQIFFLNRVKLPFCFRSRCLSDVVLTKEKGTKSVSDVLSDFKVKSEYKNLVPIVEEIEDKKIRAVWGEIFGYKNWIVID